MTKLFTSIMFAVALTVALFAVAFAQEVVEAEVTPTTTSTITETVVLSNTYDLNGYLVFDFGQFGQVVYEADCGTIVLSEIVDVPMNHPDYTQAEIASILDEFSYNVDYLVNSDAEDNVLAFPNGYPQNWEGHIVTQYVNIMQSVECFTTYLPLVVAP